MRRIVAEWLGIFVLLALVLSVVGGYATYTVYEAPGTTVEKRQVSTWQANGTYEMTATVTEPNPVYEVGTNLTGRPAYFQSISPKAWITFSFGYEASDEGKANVRVDQSLVFRSVDEDDEPEQLIEYWRVEEPIGTVEQTNIQPNETVRTSFSRNVSRLANRTANVSEQLGETPGVSQILVVSDVLFTGRVNGHSVKRTTTFVLPIELDGTTFSPGPIRSESVSGSTTERVTVQRTYGPLWKFGGPAAVLVGAATAVGLLVARRRGSLEISPAELERLEFETTRREYDDWITTATLPDTVSGRPQVEVTSLGGLVDTAIDTNERVFERPDGSAYYVLHDGHAYVYTPPTSSLNDLESRLGGDTNSTVTDGDDTPDIAGGDDSNPTDDGSSETDSN
jgi:hypothetical protein